MVFTFYIRYFLPDISLSFQLSELFLISSPKMSANLKDLKDCEYELSVMKNLQSQSLFLFFKNVMYVYNSMFCVICDPPPQNQS